MKRFFPVYIICGILFVTGCNKFGQLDEGGEKPLEIRVNIQSTVSNDSKTDGENTIIGDTVIIDDDVYITAQQELIAPKQVDDSSKIANSGADITKLTVNVLNSGTNDFTSVNSSLVTSLKYTYTSGSFIGTPSYTPPISSNKLTFLAYSPYIESSNGLSTSGTLGQMIKYAVPTDVTKHPDICVAAINNNRNIVNTGSNQAHLRTFNLYHMLTAVGFAIRGEGAKIISAEISGVSLGGTISLIDVDGGTNKWDNLTAVSEDIRAAGIVQNYYSVPWTSAWANCTQNNGYLMMVPQTLTDKATLKITYTYNKGEDSGKELSFTTQLNKLIPTWKTGTKTTYNIRLKTAPVVSSSTNMDIMSFKAGYTTTTYVPFTGMASDDNVTFTWDASWLRVHRGNPKYGDLSGGAPSGWSTGTGGPWSNIYFYAINDNNSTMKRTAKVKVKGVKSQESTIIVNQYMYPTLTLSTSNVNIHSYNSRPWESGSLNVVSYTSNYPASSVVIKSAPSWIRARIQNDRVIFDYDWNIQARIDRSATVVVAVKIGSDTYADKSFTIYQRASNFWVLLSGGSFKMGVYHSDTGSNFGGENYRCYNNRFGDRNPSTDEFSALLNEVKSGRWVGNINLATDGAQYWTSSGAGTYWGVQKYHFAYIYGWNTSLTFGFSNATFSGNRRIRCVTTSRTYLY